MLYVMLHIGHVVWYAAHWPCCMLWFTLNMLYVMLYIGHVLCYAVHVVCYAVHWTCGMLCCTLETTSREIWKPSREQKSPTYPETNKHNVLDRAIPCLNTHITESSFIDGDMQSDVLKPMQIYFWNGFSIDQLKCVWDQYALSYRNLLKW